MAIFMFKSISENIRKIARDLLADYADTQQFVYTNPGLHQVSDISYDILHGPPGQKQNEPWSQKRDEKKKYDTLRIGPGPNQVDVLTPEEPPTFKAPLEPLPPKTDAYGDVKNTTKARGEPWQEELDRDTYRSVGTWSPQEYV